MSLISAFATGARSSGATPGFAGAAVGSGVLALLGGAVIASAAAVISAGGGVVQIVGGAPSVSVGSVATAGGGALQLAGGQASANVGGAVSVGAGGGVVQIAGGQVTAIAGVPVSVSPGGGVLDLAGGQASSSAGVSVGAGGGAVQIAGGQPIVSVAVGVSVSPGGGVLDLAGGPATANVGGSISVAAGGGVLDLAGGQAISVAGVSIAAGGGVLDLAGGQANSIAGVGVSAGGGVLNLAGGLVTATAGAASNTRQVTIHVQQAQLTGDLVDFPVLITRSGLPNEMLDPVGANRARSDGGDLRAFVTVAAVKTAIPLEVAEFAYDSALAAADGICNIYCKVPSLLVASGADILLEYGAASLTQPAVTDPLGRNAVWSDAAYVTHDLVKDSTGGSADATWSGTIVSTRTPAGLKAVQLGTPLVGDSSGKITTQFSADQRPVSHLTIYQYPSNQTVLGHLWTHGAETRQSMDATRRWEYLRKYNGANQIWRANFQQSSNANWRQQAVTHDVAALAHPDQYRDETLLTLNASGTPSNPIDALTGSLIIGNDSGGASSFRGGVGPHWVWKTKVSADFVNARVHMMTNPAAFLSVGTPIGI